MSNFENQNKQEIHEALHEIDREPNREMTRKITGSMQSNKEKLAKDDGAGYAHMREIAEAMEMVQKGGSKEEAKFQIEAAKGKLVEILGPEKAEDVDVIIDFIHDQMGLMETALGSSNETFTQHDIAIPEALQKMSPLEQSLNIENLSSAHLVIPALKELASIRSEITGEPNLRPDLVYTSALSFNGNTFSIKNLIENTWGLREEEYKTLYRESQKTSTLSDTETSKTSEKLAKKSDRLERRLNKKGNNAPSRIKDRASQVVELRADLNNRVLHDRFNRALNQLRAGLNGATIQNNEDFRTKAKEYKEGTSPTEQLLTEFLDTDHNGERIKLRLGERLRNPFLAFKTAPVVSDFTVGRETKSTYRFKEYDQEGIENRRDLKMNETISPVSDREMFERLKGLTPREAQAQLEEWRKLGQKFRQAMAKDTDFRKEKWYNLENKDSDAVQNSGNKDLTIFDVRLGMDAEAMLATAKALRLENEARKESGIDTLEAEALTRILEKSGMNLDEAGTLAQDILHKQEIQDQISTILTVGRQWDKMTEAEQKAWFASLGQDIKLNEHFSFEWSFGANNEEPKFEGSIKNLKTGVSYRIPFGVNDRNELKLNLSGIYIGHGQSETPQWSPQVSAQLKSYFTKRGGGFAKASLGADLWGFGANLALGFDRRRAIMKRVENIKDENWFDGDKDANDAMRMFKAQALITDDTKGIGDAWGLGGEVGVGLRIGAQTSPSAYVGLQFNALNASMARDVRRENLNNPEQRFRINSTGQSKEALCTNLNNSSDGYMNFNVKRYAEDKQSIMINFPKLEGLPVHIMQDPRNRVAYPVSVIVNGTPKIETAFTAETTPNFHLKKVVSSAGSHWELVLSEDPYFNTNSNTNSLQRLVIGANGQRIDVGGHPDWVKANNGLSSNDIASETAHRPTGRLFEEPKLNELWEMKEHLTNAFLQQSGWKKKERASTAEKTRYRTLLTEDVMANNSALGKIMDAILPNDNSAETNREVVRQMMLEYYAPTKETRESWTTPALKRMLGGDEALANEYLRSASTAKLSKETWTQAFTMTSVNRDAIGLVLSNAQKDGQDVTRDIIQYMELDLNKANHKAALDKYLDRLKATYQNLDPANAEHQIKLENSLLAQMLKADPASLALAGIHMNHQGDILSADKEKFASMIQELYTNKESSGFYVDYTGGIGVLSSCMNPSLAINPTIRMRPAVSVIQETQQLSPNAGVSSVTTSFGVPTERFRTGNKQDSDQRNEGIVDTGNSDTYAPTNEQSNDET